MHPSLCPRPLYADGRAVVESIIRKVVPQMVAEWALTSGYAQF